MFEGKSLFSDQTPESIRDSILSNLKTDLEVGEGSYLGDLAMAQALEIHKVYGAMEQLAYIVWVTPDSGIYLDKAAEAQGLVPRKQGEKAKTTLRITGKPETVIPSGTVFMTEEYLEFITLSETVIPPSGQMLVKIEAKGKGKEYNVPENTITGQLVNIAGIETITNPETAQGGTENESDLSLYLRIDADRKKPSTSGNTYDYERWALEVSGVGYSKAISVWNGNGTVKVIIADENRKPVDNEVVERCVEHIQDQRPVGIGEGLTVVSADPQTIQVSAQLILEKNGTIRDITQQFEEKIAEYFGTISLIHNEVLYHWIGATLLEITGVRDYSNLLLNGDTHNITLTEEEIPELGRVTLDEAI